MTNKEKIKSHIEYLEEELALRPDYYKPYLECEITQYKNILKDLEEYERIKELIGTPIQELMNKLKELEQIKEFVVDRTAFYDTGCFWTNTYIMILI